MSFQSTYDKIIEKWKGTEYEFLIKDLHNCSLGAATGGEGIGIIGKYLKDLEENNINAYNLVKDLIEEYLDLWSRWAQNLD